MGESSDSYRQRSAPQRSWRSGISLVDRILVDVVVRHTTETMRLKATGARIVDQRPDGTMVVEHPGGRIIEHRNAARDWGLQQILDRWGEVKRDAGLPRKVTPARRTHRRTPRRGPSRVRRAATVRVVVASTSGADPPPSGDDDPAPRPADVRAAKGGAS